MKRIKGLFLKLYSLFLPSPVQESYADAGDLLRVICVALIGWYHIWQQSWLNPDLHILGKTLRLYPIVACGYMFVDLMLLLSGFLMMLGFLSGRRRRTGAFYAARAARILPSYLLCIGVMFLLTLIVPENAYSGTKHMWTDVLSHLSFTHNFFPEAYSYTKLNGALWTLAVEVQFYLIFPLLARAFEKRPALTYACMTAIAFVCRWLIGTRLADTTIYVNRLSAMLDVYANGMLAALAYRRLSKRPQRAAEAWLCTLAAIACAACVYMILSRQLARSGGENIRMGQLLWRYPLSLLGGLFLICGSRAVRLFRLLMSNRLVRFLSGISFNFYIWHQFIAVQLKKLRIPTYTGTTPNQDGQQPWQSRYTLCCFAAALIAATLITYLVEKPCARWLKRRLSSRQTLETSLPK